jgi:uncharacterized protein YxjI
MGEERLYCMHCGARIVPGATFCRICGYPVNRRSAPVEPKEPMKERIQPEPAPIEEETPPETTESPSEYPPQEKSTEQANTLEAQEETPEQPSVSQPQENVAEEENVSPTKEEQPVAAAAEAPPEEVEANAPLFDPRRLYYIFDRSWWGFGAGRIYDQKGNVIGHFYRRVISVRRSIEFREADNATVSAVLHKKLTSLDTMEIENGHQLHLARIKMKIQKTESPGIWLEDLQGNLMLSPEGNFGTFSFVVYDRLKNEVAEVDKAEKWKNIFVGEDGFDIKGKHAIFIQEGVQCERRFILALMIAVEETLHEENKTKPSETEDYTDIDKPSS